MSKWFNLNNKELIKSCKPALKELFQKSKKKYIELFLQEKDTEIKGINLDPLLKTEIIKRVGNKFRANVQVFPLSGKFICTDFIFSIHRIKNSRFIRRINDVWAILPYESAYIAKKAIENEKDFVLDLATGSGIIAIFCADKAKKVIATDINPKAVNYAKFNVILNDLEDKIEVREGNLFEPVNDLKFDLIIWNGPTVAVPKTPEKYPIYAYGGLDGLDFTRKFIKQSPKHLQKKGRIQWLEFGIGNVNRPEILKIIEKEWQNLNFKVLFERRVKPADLFRVINYHDERMEENPLNRPSFPLWIKPINKEEEQNWHNFLKKNNFTHIHSGVIKVYPNTHFEIKIASLEEKESFKRMLYFLPNDWHFLGYKRILQILKICENY